LSPLAVRLVQVRALAREDPERPAHEVIEPLMLAVLAQRTGHSPLTMTVGTDLGRKWHAWVASLPRSHDGPAFLANHLERLALFAHPCFRAFILLFTSVGNMWVRIRALAVGSFSYLLPYALEICTKRYKFILVSF
jgi:hypothetical protein